MFLGLPEPLTCLLIRIKTTNIESTCRHFPGVHLHLFHHIMSKITWCIVVKTTTLSQHPESHALSL